MNKPLGAWLVAVLVLLFGYSVVQALWPQYAAAAALVTLLSVGLYYFGSSHFTNPSTPGGGGSGNFA